MPGPAILFCVSGPICLMSIFNLFGWKAPFRISSTPKGDKVLPGVYYIMEDIIAVNAGGGRPFREGMAARYKASPIFRKMIREQSWFWSIPGLLVAAACTVVVVVNEVPEPVAYGIGWAVPFIWAAIWAVITVPWVRSALYKEKISWEEEEKMMTSTMLKPPVPPAGRNSGANKVSEEPSSSGETTVDADTEERKVEVNEDQTDVLSAPATSETLAQESHSGAEEAKP